MRSWISCLIPSESFSTDRHNLSSKCRVTYFTCASAFLLLAVTAMSRAHANEKVFPLPQLAYETQKGLDAKNNPLDRIISVWGFSCFQMPPGYKRPCSIEAELVRFLSALSGNINNLEQLLTQLGAKCDRNDRELHCVYSRRVESCYWLAGADAPARVVDHHFEIRTSTYDDKGLRHSAKFKRDGKSGKIMRATRNKEESYYSAAVRPAPPTPNRRSM